MLEAVVFAASEESGEVINPLIPALYDIVWSLVCFAVIVGFFVWKVLPNVQKTLDNRAEVIEGGIKRAENAQAEANAALERYNEQLSEARAEAGRIREAARADGVKIINELKAQASAEAARITANASAQIEAERQSALASLRSEVGSLAIDLASGVIGENLSNDRKSAALVDRFLADLEASEARNRAVIEEQQSLERRAVLEERGAAIRFSSE